MNNQNKALKTGRVVSAIVFLLIAAFSFLTLSVKFNVSFLVVGILCTVFPVYTLIKLFVTPREKQERQEDFEL